MRRRDDVQVMPGSYSFTATDATFPPQECCRGRLHQHMDGHRCSPQLWL